MHEKDSSDRSEELPSPPDGYIRRESVFKIIGAAVGVLGAMLGIIRFFDAYRNYVDTAVHNERIERINSDNRIENRLDSCCDRRRR